MIERRAKKQNSLENIGRGPKCSSTEQFGCKVPLYPAPAASIPFQLCFCFLSLQPKKVLRLSIQTFMMICFSVRLNAEGYSRPT